jgi:DNA-binding XRE family transcriptional regulator
MMATEMTKSPRRPIDVGEAAMTMAVGIILDRINRLSDEDRVYLFDFVKEIGSATCEEDIEAIRNGMLEILDQAPSEVREFGPTVEGSPELDKWVQHLAGKVRALREAAGKTQVQLAQQSGLTQSHISRIENAELAPSHKTVEKLAAALGVAPSDLDPTR